jgi:hypothetical protein
VRKYLQTLLDQKKWQSPVKNIRIGDVVLIKNFHVERGHWPLGRIIKGYYGNDGLVRVVMFKLAMVCLKERSLNLRVNERRSTPEREWFAYILRHLLAQ